MLKIYPYKLASASAKKLKEATGAMFIKLENSKYRHRAGNTIINWGNSNRIANLEGVVMLNEPEAVAVAANKLLALQKLEENDVRIVPFTTDKDTAEGWLQEGEKVFVRKKLNGHSGEGIEVIQPDNNPINTQLANIAQQLDMIGYGQIAQRVTEEIIDIHVDLPDAPLYTMGIQNNGEYRVHVFDGEVILYQKKSRRVDEETGEVITAEGEDADIRNLASNWIYRTGNLRRLERVEELAVNAIEALGLDFGAVDILMDNNGDVYVLEVNTAPGLGNAETLQAYTAAINSLEV